MFFGPYGEYIIWIVLKLARSHTGILRDVISWLRVFIKDQNFRLRHSLYQIVFDLLKLNIVENEVSDNVEARKFDWGDESHVDAVAAEEWDLVIGADCVFSLAATKLLVACLDRLIKSPDIVGYQSIETRDDAVTAAFLEGIRNHGLDVVSVSLRGIHKKYLHEDLAIYKITRA